MTTEESLDLKEVATVLKRGSLLRAPIAGWQVVVVCSTLNVSSSLVTLNYSLWLHTLVNFMLW